MFVWMMEITQLDRRYKSIHVLHLCSSLETPLLFATPCHSHYPIPMARMAACYTATIPSKPLHRISTSEFYGYKLAIRADFNPVVESFRSI